MVTKLVGKRVAQLRHRLGLSQVAFAEQVGMARTYFAEVETGKRNVSVRNLERITSALGVTLEEFFASDIFDPLYNPTRGPGRSADLSGNTGSGHAQSTSSVRYAFVELPQLDD